MCSLHSLAVLWPGYCEPWAQCTAGEWLPSSSRPLWSRDWSPGRNAHLEQHIKVRHHSTIDINLLYSQLDLKMKYITNDGDEKVQHLFCQSIPLYQFILWIESHVINKKLFKLFSWMIVEFVLTWSLLEQLPLKLSKSSNRNKISMRKWLASILEAAIWKTIAGREVS